jgi:hypothetical protein
MLTTPERNEPQNGWSVGITDGGECVASAGDFYVSFTVTADDCRRLAALFARHAERLDKGEIVIQKVAIDLNAIKPSRAERRRAEREGRRRG